MPRFIGKPQPAASQGTGEVKQDFSTRLVSFIGQKGGVGKSSLARLLSVGAARAGQKVLLADFDLEQLTCLEWNALRLRNNLEPEIDVRSFKSLKKLRKTESTYDLIVADTRGLADELTKDVAEESSVVFLPTGTSSDDLRPTLALARKLAKHGAEGKLMLVLAKTGRSERQITIAVNRSRTAALPCSASIGPSATVFSPNSILAASGSKHAIATCAKSPIRSGAPCSIASSSRDPTDRLQIKCP